MAVRVGVDVGGTFTDAVMRRRGDAARSRRTKVLTTAARPVRGDARGAAAAGRRPVDRRRLPPRLHGRHQRRPDPHGRQDRDAGHRRPPRHRRHRPRLAPVRREPLRPDLGAPPPGRPDRRPPLPPRGPGAAARGRRGAAAARRGRGPPRARVPQGRRRRVGRHLLHPRLRAPRPRAAGARDRRRGDARRLRPDLARSGRWPREFERTFVVMLDAYTGPPVVKLPGAARGAPRRGGLRQPAWRSCRWTAACAPSRAGPQGPRLHAAVGPGRRPARRRDLLARAARRPATSSASTSAAPAPTSASIHRGQRRGDQRVGARARDPALDHDPRRALDRRRRRQPDPAPTRSAR